MIEWAKREILTRSKPWSVLAESSALGAFPQTTTQPSVARLHSFVAHHKPLIPNLGRAPSCRIVGPRSDRLWTACRAVDFAKADEPWSLDFGHWTC